MPVRNQEKGEQAVKHIQEANSSLQNTGKLKLMHLDLGSLQSVRQCTAAFRAEYRQLNILINNAGARANAPSCKDNGDKGH